MFVIFENLFRKKKEKKKIDIVKPKNFSETLTPELLAELKKFASPPRDVGLPVYTVDELLVSQEEIIHEIFYLSGRSKEKFDQDILSIIRKYTEFVCLLPASKDHHHHTPGGLLRHSLEVSYYSYKKTRTVLFSQRENSERRRYLEEKWKLACFIAGLLHDIGKIVTDMEVYDESGKLRWSPLEMSLIQWCEENQLDRYYYKWNVKREHNDHLIFNSSFWKMLLPKHIIDFLTTYDNTILRTLIIALSGDDKKKNKISSIISEADQKSVKKNRAGSASLHNKETLDIPIEEIVLNGIKDLTKDKWKVNKPGARIWVDKEGIYIVWHAAFTELRSHLIGSGHKGIPSEADKVADMLIESGYVDEFINHEGFLKRYYNIEPQLQGFNTTKMTTIKILRSDLVFDDVKPEPIILNYPDRRVEASKDEVEKKTASEKKDKTKIEMSKQSKPKAEVIKSKENDSVTTKKQITEMESANTSLLKEKSENKTLNYFRNNKMIGEFIINLVEDVQDDLLIKNKHFVITKEGLYAFKIPYTIEQYGFDEMIILSELMQIGWIEIQPEKPGMKIQRIAINGTETKTVVLNRSISQKINELLELSFTEKKIEPLDGVPSIEKNIKPDQVKNTNLKENEPDIIKLISDGINQGDAPAWFDDNLMYIDHDKIYQWLNDKHTNLELVKIKKVLISLSKKENKNNKSVNKVNNKRCLTIRYK